MSFPIHVSRAKISDPQKGTKSLSNLRIPGQEKTREFARARSEAETHNDQALRRVAYLLMEWGDTPRRRQFGEDMLGWRARLSGSQARTLLLMAYEVQSNLERREQAAQSHARVMEAIQSMNGTSARLGP